MNNFTFIDLHQFLSDIWNTATDLHLSHNEFEYLYAIHKAEQSTINELSHNNSSHLSSLASTMSIKKSSASIMLNKLEKKGFIKRIDCRYDSRAQHILLSEKGRNAFFSTLNKINQHINQHISSELNESETNIFHSVIEKLVHANKIKEK